MEIPARPFDSWIWCWWQCCWCNSHEMPRAMSRGEPMIDAVTGVMSLHEAGYNLSLSQLFPLPMPFFLHRKIWVHNNLRQTDVGMNCMFSLEGAWIHVNLILSQLQDIYTWLTSTPGSAGQMKGNHERLIRWHKRKSCWMLSNLTISKSTTVFVSLPTMD